jgi:hypothetical protein
LLEQLSVSGVIVEHLAMPVFFSGPEIVPASPEAVVAEIYGQEPMKVRQPLLGEEVQRQRCPGVIRDAGSLLAKLGDVGFGALVGSGANQIRRKPELSLALMNFHQLADDVFQVLEHLDLRVQFPGGVGRDAHGLPSTTGTRSEDVTGQQR